MPTSKGDNAASAAAAAAPGMLTIAGGCGWNDDEAAGCP